MEQIKPVVPLGSYLIAPFQRQSQQREWERVESVGVGRDVAQKQKPWRPGLLPSKNCRKASFSSSTSMLLFPLQAKAVRPQEIGAVLRASKPMNTPGNLHILFLDVKHLFSHQLEPVKMATFSSVIRRWKGLRPHRERKKKNHREGSSDQSISLSSGTVSVLPLVFVLRTFVLSDTYNYIKVQ